mmetsp:Transcript_11099/g.25133  ORF Transcript_11099/g.25133 Transcript_11099/m.25133 type:complete len:239 (-) Transcript_11099:181-897(-)
MLAKIVFVLLSVFVMVAASALAQEDHDHDHGHDDEMASALAEEDHDHDHHGHDDETKKGCANNELCKKAFQTVLMAHDICEEEQLPLSLEVGLHVFEDKCEDVLCNSASEPFDPMVANCDHDDHDHDHDHDDHDHDRDHDDEDDDEDGTSPEDQTAVDMNAEERVYEEMTAATNAANEAMMKEFSDFQDAIIDPMMEELAPSPDALFADDRYYRRTTVVRRRPIAPGPRVVRRTTVIG